MQKHVLKHKISVVKKYISNKISHFLFIVGKLIQILNY